ncbi:hypothetical protein CRYUN_Cryun11dG0080700 [Craigia yunnanensis]
MTFCLRYLGGIETRFNRVGRNFDGGNVESSKKLSVFKQIGRAPGKATPQELSREDLSKAHLYVLKNYDEVRPFIEEHKQLISSTLGGNARNIDNIHDKEFPNWFQKKMILISVQHCVVTNPTNIFPLPIV